MLCSNVEEALDAHLNRLLLGMIVDETAEEECQGLSVFECLRATLS
jgi:hypothetical protein